LEKERKKKEIKKERKKERNKERKKERKKDNLFIFFIPLQNKKQRQPYICTW
jgi:hypothetical protein